MQGLISVFPRLGCCFTIKLHFVLPVFIGLSSSIEGADDELHNREEW